MLSAISARDTVVNLHFAIPHHNDGGRDDVQVLWDSESLHNNFYSNTSDITSTAGCGGLTTGAACANAIGLGTPVYIDSVNYNCPGNVGKTFTAAQLAGQNKCVGTYYFPDSTNRTATFQPIQGGDTIWNDQEIVKLQYTHNFGSSAFVRVYGYTYYSDWLQNGPQSLYADFAGCCSPDYELTSHTRGGSIQFQDQINAQNLVSLSEDYTTANSVRDNNSFYACRTGGSRRQRRRTRRAGTATDRPAARRSTAKAVPSTFGTIQSGLAPGTSGAVPNLPASCPNPTVGTTQCAYLLAENGNHATYNQVVPQFWSSSLTDEFRPTDKWLFNLGIRLDSFTFDGSNTNTGAARNLWTNAFNLDNCVNNVSGVRSFPRLGP